MVEYNLAKINVARSNRVIHSQDRVVVAYRFHSPEINGSNPFPAQREVVEWFNTSDLKSEKLKNFVGSNPILSFLFNFFMKTSLNKRLKFSKKIILRKKKNKRHLLTKKSSKRKNRLKKTKKIIKKLKFL